VKLPVCDICNTFHVKVKTACDAFVEKYIDCEWHVSSCSIINSTIAVQSITSVRLFYGLSNCTILSISPTPLYVSDYTKVMSHFSAGMEWRDRLVTSGNSTGLQCQTESSNWFWDHSRMFFFLFLFFYFRWLWYHRWL